MDKYVFGTKINGTENSGIVDISSQSLICICTKENSKIILDALNLQPEPEMTEKEIDDLRNKLILYDEWLYTKGKESDAFTSEELVDEFLNPKVK